ncbi:MAG: hypothetical protein ACFFAO_15670 [Candidatus Hermodarchaeota archaeon]
MTKDNWKAIFQSQMKLRKKLLECITKEDGHLKFNRSYIIVSDIASQFYSEAQLELNYIFGKIETEEQKEGSQLHEKMAEDATVIQLNSLLKKIATAEQTVVVESGFLMKFNDEIVVGKPDVIIFKRGIPLFVFEYKFSKYTTPFPNQQVQAQIYCQILETMGYNTDLLCYGIIIAPRDMSKKNIEVKTIPKKVFKTVEISSLIQEQTTHLMFEKINVYLYKFDAAKAAQDLVWALKFWKRERFIKLSDLLHACQYHKYKERCELTYSIVQDLVEKFGQNIITIYGIGSFFDKKLPENWIKHDIDVICVVEDLEKIPKFQDWTDVKRLDYEKDQITANVFFNSLEGLKHQKNFEKESWANYKWALLGFKVPHNSVILYGRPLYNELPELEPLSYDYEDILRHALYNLNTSFTLNDLEASKNRFTKGVFKFAFLLCVYFDKSFNDTSIVEITSTIRTLVEDKKIETNFYEILLYCVKYRCGIPFLEDFFALRKQCIASCFSLLVEGTLWKLYDWDEVIEFCHTAYKGLHILADIASEQKRIYP